MNRSTFRRACQQLLGLWWLVLATGAAADCAPRHVITFPDGSKSCLTDYPFAEQRAAGSVGALYRQVPVHGGYQLALPRRPAMCAPAVGLWALAGSTISMNASGLGGNAQASCQGAAGSAAAGSACECVLVISSGTGQVARTVFERMAREAATPRSLQLDPGWRAGEASSAGANGTCAPRFVFSFADGTRGCFTDYALAGDSARGWVGPMRRSVPASGNFNVAASPRGGACPVATGFAYTGLSGAQLALGTDTASRSAKALRECDSQLGQAADGCACQLLLADGQSPLTRPAFEAFVGHRAVAVAAAPPAASAPAPSPQPSPPPAVRPAPPAPQPAAASPAPNPELAALRQQLEALQAQVARQAAAPPTPAAQPALPRLRARALVVGNGAYAQLGALPNPRRDAQAIAAKLRQFGIEVDLVVDADRSQLVKALNDYQTRAAGYDVNIFFYAGHGLQVGGINYIVPVDMAVGGASVGSIKLNSVSLNDALEYLPARTRIVFLDACRDNPLSRSLMASRTGAAIGLAPVNTTSGTLVAYATKDGSVAEDGSGANSPYTTALLQHLDAEEDIAVVLRRVRQSVLKSTANRQEPWEYGSLVGDQLVLSRISKP